MTTLLGYWPGAGRGYVYLCMQPLWGNLPGAITVRISYQVDELQLHTPHNSYCVTHKSNILAGLSTFIHDKLSPIRTSTAPKVLTTQ